MSVRLIHLGAVLAACSCVATALAQGSNQDVSISASIPIACSISGSANPAAINTSIPVSATGVVDTTTQTFTVGNIVCNGLTNVSATSLNDGVRTPGAAVPNFSNVINYRGTAVYGKAKSSVMTTGKGPPQPNKGNSSTTAGSTNGQLVIEIRPQQPANPLVMGTDYSDVLRVTLTPQ